MKLLYINILILSLLSCNSKRSPQNPLTIIDPEVGVIVEDAELAQRLQDAPDVVIVGQYTISVNVNRSGISAYIDNSLKKNNDAYWKRNGIHVSFFLNIIHVDSKKIQIIKECDKEEDANVCHWIKTMDGVEFNRKIKIESPKLYVIFENYIYTVHQYNIKTYIDVLKQGEFLYAVSTLHLKNKAGPDWLDNNMRFIVVLEIKINERTYLLNIKNCALTETYAF